MPQLKIAFSPKFKRNYKKMTLQEQGMIKAAIGKMVLNPFAGGLKTKKYYSRPATFESRVNIKIRILWRFTNKNEIILDEVGYHDIL
ncbi:MAG: hypothetical protein KGZ41_05130 [Dethiobacter sp.]|nr:hypothetical protein [Dethiobacter sp.]MBS3898629.1 hypothetical protein [Dethiobacter sp.]MBS3983162.1 hypothetical protein [Dethiobacter sp.]MCL4464155.1 cytotoxin [Bacillota bacterium]MCL5992717.1 cytotoxin [Bacillota bacterium]